VSTVVASVAVVCAVALTNSVALVDSAGSPAGAQPVVVPTPSGTVQTDSPTPSAPPTAPSASTPRAPAVPVPPAQDEAAPEQRTPSQTPKADDATNTRTSAPVVVADPPPAAHVAPATLEAAIAESRASGSWDAVREWAASVGWTSSRIDAWITHM